ncbi:MAG: hypothetical protein HOH43_16255, partial [Candidatus Latescibacteria bacterium]|nr:hypothetical protein [Candidatus Latescibacterota bacterium]
VTTNCIRQNLDGNLTIQFAILSKVYLSHPALANGADDGIVTYDLTLVHDMVITYVKRQNGVAFDQTRASGALILTRAQISVSHLGLGRSVTVITQVSARGLA